MHRDSKNSRNPHDPSKDFYTASRKIVGDLFEPDARIYWADFLVSVTIAYGTALIFMASPVSRPHALCAFAVAVVALYRGSLFVHEIVHLNKPSLRSFRTFWELVAGVPMMVPTFAYKSHLHHHNSHHFGTENDGEYLPLANGTLREVLFFLAQILLQPIFVFVRFLILTPLSFAHPRLRSWITKHASSLVINFRYQRDMDTLPLSRFDVFLEIACSLRAWLPILLIAFGVTDWMRLSKILMLAMGALTLNHVRTLAAHRYTNDGDPMSHLDQFHDSTIVIGNWASELLYPLGLRYHALHHLFPALPYHNLGIAHRRLVEQLPADSPYHQSIYPSTLSVLQELIHKIRRRPNNHAQSRGHHTSQGNQHPSQEWPAMR